MNRPSIYIIRNVNNGKVYVGSAVNPQKRRSEHFRRLRLGTHHSPLLQRAWEKHGEDAFEFLAIEAVDDTANLLKREQFWLDEYQSFKPSRGYNVCVTAGSRLGAKVSDVGRANISRAKTGANKGERLTDEHRAKIAQAHRGKRHSAEARERMSAAAKARRSRPTSSETKAKISEARKGAVISTEHRLAISKANTGKVASPETRAKLSAAAAAAWAKKKNATNPNES